MRTTILLAVTLVAMMLGAQAGVPSTETVIPNLGLGTGVIELTSKTFDHAVLESGKGAFVFFFVPWCENFSLLQNPARSTTNTDPSFRAKL